LGSDVEAAEEMAKAVEVKAKAAEEKAKVVEEMANDLSEELAKDSGDRAQPLAETPVPSAEAKEIAAGLTAQQRAALQAMGLLSRRTRTGIARDANIPRNKIKEVLDGLHDRGIVEFATSGITGALRVALTPFGASVQSSLPVSSPDDDRINTGQADPDQNTKNG
jgi:hypothetical protein